MKAMLRRGELFPLLSFILILTSIGLYGQEGFRLSDYKNPDYHWKRLDMQFGLGGNNGLNSNKYAEDNSNQFTNSSLGSNLGLNYYNTRNSMHYQGEQYFYLSGSVNSAFSTKEIFQDDAGQDSKNEMKKNFQNGMMVLSSDNRLYNNRKQFIETDIHLSSDFGHSMEKNSADPEYLPFNNEDKAFHYGAGGSIAFLAGLGRIEDVQDARLAKYIVDDLDVSGDLARVPSDEEVMALATFITELKNERYYDFRVRKMEEITAIDSFLTVNGLRTAPDASYFTIINDDWDYANGPIRSTGYRFSFGVRPSFEYGKYESEAIYQDTLTDPAVLESYSNKLIVSMDAWGLDALVSWLWEKPASLVWQHSIYAETRYALFHKNYKDEYFEKDIMTYSEKDILNTPNLAVQGNYTIGYYPNTRTSIKLAVDARYNQYWGTEQVNENAESDVNKTIVYGGLRLDCYYYISQQLRFTLVVDSYYQFIRNEVPMPEGEQEFLKTNDLNSGLRAGLVYSIF